MNILLGVTGSVAAKLSNKIQKAITDAGHDVKTVFTESALHFHPEKLKVGEYDDSNEWSYYKANDKVLHIDLVKWADKFIIAPCTANTLTKIHLGFCDNLLTSCVRAWPNDKDGIILVPAMNTEMFNKPILEKQYHELVIRDKFQWVPPQEKELFCGDKGVGAMANISDIVNKI